MSNTPAADARLVAILTARPDRAEALRDALSAIIPRVRSEPGCLRYELHVDKADEHRLIMVEAWESEAALAAHVAAPAFQSLAARFDELLDRPLEIIHLEFVAVS